MTPDGTDPLLEQLGKMRRATIAAVPFRITDVVNSPFTARADEGFRQQLQLSAPVVAVALEERAGELVALARTELPNLTHARVLLVLTPLESDQVAPAPGIRRGGAEEGRGDAVGDDAGISITGRIVLRPDASGCSGSYAFGPVADVVRRIGREFRWSAVLVPGRASPGVTAPTAEYAIDQTDRTTVGPKATLAPLPAPGPDAGAVAFAMLSDAVERAVHDLLDGPAREPLAGELDARDGTGRLHLARAVARRLWGTERMPHERAVVYWPAVARAIRARLQRATEAPGGAAARSTVWVGRVADGDVTVPHVAPPAGWRAAVADYESAIADDPRAAAVVELHTYLGLPADEIAAVLGITEYEVRLECKLLERALTAEAP